MAKRGRSLEHHPRGTYVLYNPENQAVLQEEELPHLKYTSFETYGEARKARARFIKEWFGVPEEGRHITVARIVVVDDR